MIKCGFIKNKQIVEKGAIIVFVKLEEFFWSNPSLTVLYPKINNNTEIRD